MTQRVFDVENEQDMQDLWDILPDDVVMVVKDESHGWAKNYCKFKRNDYSDKTAGTLFNINWHNKTEITRPIQEATEEDIGKLCMFWENSSYKFIGVLGKMREKTEQRIYNVEGLTIWWTHCRRLTKQES